MRSVAVAVYCDGVTSRYNRPRRIDAAGPAISTRRCLRANPVSCSMTDDNEAGESVAPSSPIPSIIVPRDSMSMIDHILGEWSAIQLYNAVMLFRGDDDPSRMTRNHGDSRRDLPRRIIM